MKYLSLLLVLVFLSGCATTSSYHYQPQNNPQQWKGRNITDLQKQWGQADQIMHTRVGTSFYLYTGNSSASFFASTTTNFGMYGQPYTRPNVESNMMLKCTTVFKTDDTGTIVDVYHQGSNCGGQWVSGPTQKKS